MFAKHALNRFNNLLSALCTVHPRISAKFPSKFLSTELSTLLIAFTNAVETVESSAVTGIVERLLAFLKVVRPQLQQGRRPSSFERPPLPPRVSTGASLVTTDQESEQDDPEDQLQARLIASFLSHVLSGYLLRTRRPAVSQSPPIEHEGHSHSHPEFGGFDDIDERGLEIGWAGKYDELVLRPDKSKVPGGRTLIDEERAKRATHKNIKAVVDEVSFICERLGVKTEELLYLCRAGAGIFSPRGCQRGKLLMMCRYSLGRRGRRIGHTSTEGRRRCTFIQTRRALPPRQPSSFGYLRDTCLQDLS